MELNIEQKDLPLYLNVGEQKFAIRALDGLGINIHASDGKHILVSEFGEDFLNLLTYEKPVTSVTVQNERK
jgi:hypothetical protein